MKELIGTSVMQYSLIICGVFSLMLLIGSVYAASPEQSSNETLNTLNDSQSEKTVNMYVIIPITLKMDMGNGFRPDHFGNGMEFGLNETGNMSLISPERMKEMNRTNGTVMHHIIDRNVTDLVRNDSVPNTSVSGNMSQVSPERMKETNRTNGTVMHHVIDRNITDLVQNDSVSNTSVSGNITIPNLKINISNST